MLGECQLGTHQLGSECAESGDLGKISANLDLRAYFKGQQTADLTLLYGMSPGQAQAAFELFSGNSGSAQAALDLNVIDAGSASQSQLWSISVAVDGVELKCTGRITVDGEEGTARIAQFSVSGVPAYGIGASVIIDAQTTAGSGRLFSGKIDEPEYDPASRITTYHCSDSLKQRMEAATREQIDQLTPGAVWSDDVGGQDVEGWDYFQARMETLPASYELDAYGVGHLTSWNAGDAWPTITKDIDRSVQIQLARADTLCNRIVVTADYRWVRLAKRFQAYRWQPWYSFCENLLQQLSYPTVSMVKQAVDGTGWDLEQLDVVNPPPSEFVLCNNMKIGWVISPELRAEIITRAGISTSKRFSRSMQAKYALTIEAPESIARHGVYVERENDSLSIDYEDTDWRDGIADAPGVAITDPNGDTVYDQGDAARFAQWMTVLIARAKVRILSSHRQGAVVLDTRLQPALGCHHRVPFDIPSVTASGKVKQFTHVVDIESGLATTTIKIGISEGGGADGSLAAPAAPDPADIATLPDAATLIDLDTHIGGLQSSPEYDDTWTGYIGNTTIPYPGSFFYDTMFRIEAPQIDTGSQDSADAQLAEQYSVGVPDDTFNLH